MYDKELIVELLSKMIEATEKVLHRSRNISSVDDFLENDESLMLLDSLCMQFIALGEAVKKIDKLTDTFYNVSKYPMERYSWYA